MSELTAELALAHETGAHWAELAEQRQKRIHELAAQANKFKDEAEALRKDAERYRWLRSHHILAHVQVEQENGECPYVYAEELDRSIDEIRAFRND